MGDTITTVGLEMALDLLAETTKIQEDGGLITQDGKYVNVCCVCLYIICMHAFVVCVLSLKWLVLF